MLKIAVLNIIAVATMLLAVLSSQLSWAAEASDNDALLWLSQDYLVLDITSEQVNGSARGDQHFETILRFRGLNLSLTKGHLDVSGGFRDIGLKSPIPSIVDLKSAKGVMFAFNGEPFLVPSSLGMRVLRYLLEGPEQRFVYEASGGERLFTCHQFAAFCSFPNVFRVEDDPLNTDVEVYTETYPDAETTTPASWQAGDYIMFFGHDRKSKHSAIFLGQVDGSPLFLSKHGLGTLAVSTLSNLITEYPPLHICRVTKITMRRWNAF